MKTKKIDGLSLVALGLVLVMGLHLLTDGNRPVASAQNSAFAADYSFENSAPAAETESAPDPNPDPDPAAFGSLYDAYVITQGLHGQSYGHLAIDLGGGNGAQIYSPIHGTVTENYTDGLGNPTLVLENEVYRVTLLHGVYTVAVGDMVSLGDPIGAESNLGNTTDFEGRSCRGRDCGYHTHLNVFDKRIEANVNPLDLLP